MNCQSKKGGIFKWSVAMKKFMLLWSFFLNMVSLFWPSNAKVCGWWVYDFINLLFEPGRFLNSIITRKGFSSKFSSKSWKMKKKFLKSLKKGYLFKCIKVISGSFEEFKKGVPLQMHKCDLWEEYIGLAAWKMIFHGSSKFSISLMETPRVVKN